MGNGLAVRHKGEWKTDHLNAKIFNVRLERGDAYKMLSGGGGGFGWTASSTWLPKTCAKAM